VQDTEAEVSTYGETSIDQQYGRWVQPLRLLKTDGSLQRRLPVDEHSYNRNQEQ